MTNPNDALREALAFYADDANWRQNGPLDPTRDGRTMRVDLRPLRSAGVNDRFVRCGLLRGRRASCRRCRAKTGQSTLQGSPRGVRDFDPGACRSQDEGVRAVLVEPPLDFGPHVAELLDAHVALDVWPLQSVESSDARRGVGERSGVLGNARRQGLVGVGEAADLVPTRGARRVRASGEDRPDVTGIGEDECRGAEQCVVEMGGEDERACSVEGSGSGAQGSHVISMTMRSVSQLSAAWWGLAAAGLT